MKHKLFLLLVFLSCLTGKSFSQSAFIQEMCSTRDNLAEFMDTIVAKSQENATAYLKKNGFKEFKGNYYGSTQLGRCKLPENNAGLIYGEFLEVEEWGVTYYALNYTSIVKLQLRLGQYKTQEIDGIKVYEKDGYRYSVMPFVEKGGLKLYSVILKRI